MTKRHQIYWRAKARQKRLEASSRWKSLLSTTWRVTTTWQRFTICRRRIDFTTTTTITISSFARDFPRSPASSATPTWSRRQRLARPSRHFCRSYTRLRRRISASAFPILTTTWCYITMVTLIITIISEDITPMSTNQKIKIITVTPECTLRVARALTRAVQCWPLASPGLRARSVDRKPFFRWRTSGFNVTSSIHESSWSDWRLSDERIWSANTCQWVTPSLWHYWWHIQRTESSLSQHAKFTKAYDCFNVFSLGIAHTIFTAIAKVITDGLILINY